MAKRKTTPLHSEAMPAMKWKLSFANASSARLFALSEQWRNRSLPLRVKLTRGCRGRMRAAL